jgi:hypothetical protein
MVLVAALLVMAMLSLLGIAGLATSTLEVKIAGHDRDAKQAFYLAEAGLLRAQYEIVRGSGQGTGGGPAGGPYTFAWDAEPSVVGGWAADKWVNFVLVDGRGVECTILAHASGGSFDITQCLGPLQPAAGRASLYYRNNGVALSAAGVAGPNSMSVAGATWALDVWGGFRLRDSGGALYEITGNTADTLDVTGNPANGSFQILRAVGGAGEFVFYANPDSGEPAGPNPEWPDKDFGFEGWYLRDSEDALYPITGHDYDTNAAGIAYLKLEVAGTPASGAFQVVANPWLAANGGATLSFAASSGGAFEAPSGLDYGSAEVTVVVTAPGRYRITSRSTGTAVGSIKAIALDASLGAGGAVELRNWRQVR